MAFDAHFLWRRAQSCHRKRGVIIHEFASSADVPVVLVRELDSAVDCVREVGVQPPQDVLHFRVNDGADEA
jgi:hypothetical protein